MYPTWLNCCSKGPDALANVQMLLTNDFSDMEDGQGSLQPHVQRQGRRSG